jgi:hypothetical protein
VAAILDKTTGAVKALEHRGQANLDRILSRRGPQDDDAAATLRASLGREDTSHGDIEPTARADGE